MLNLIVLIDIVRIFFAMRSGAYDEQQLERRLHDRGLMNRFVFGRLSRAVDARAGTCTRWACCSAWASTRPPRSGCSPSRPASPRTPCRSGAVLSLPILFAAGMSLMDTADGAFMSPRVRLGVREPRAQGLLQHHRHRPVRGGRAADRHGRAAAGRLPRSCSSSGGAWDWLNALDFELLGYVVVGAFVATWVVSVAVWKLHRVEERWSRHLDLDHRKDTIR